MTFTIGQILAVIVTHFFADFVFQTDKQAKGKSKDNWALTSHVVTYTGVLFWGAFLFCPSNSDWFLVYVLGNGALHWVTDYFTSRLNARLWAEGRVHDFFVGVGFDQVIHYTCLFVTLGLLS